MLQITVLLQAAPRYCHFNTVNFYYIGWKCEIRSARIRLCICLSSLSVPKTDFKGCCYTQVYRTKLICSNVMLLHSEVKNLPRIVLKNSYLNHLFDLASKKIEKTTELKTWKNDDNNFPYRISISDIGNFSHKFGCNLEK